MAVSAAAGDPSKVKAAGPGLEPGNVVSKMTYFTISIKGKKKKISLSYFIKIIFYFFKRQPFCFNFLILKCFITSEAGEGPVDVVINDPSGNPNAVKPKIQRQPDGSYRVEYTPKVTGVHTISIVFCGQPIPKSPISVTITTGKYSFS